MRAHAEWEKSIQSKLSDGYEVITLQEDFTRSDIGFQACAGNEE